MDKSKGYGKLVGQSPEMQGIYHLFERIKGADAQTILIYGESGTGKDLAAQTIHMFGPRTNETFTEIDCAALPEQLVESELFGHEKGAFTDAHQMKRGLFELAKGGTIFLDEIGDMPLSTQAKLLRAIENRRFKRIGGLQDLSLDAALIAATNKNLEDRVAKGLFREDLYFRLNVVPIRMPPLRDRGADIELLAHHFMEHFNRQFARNTKQITPQAIQVLTQYHWPGNVRELKNTIERVMILHSNLDSIDLDHLPPAIEALTQSRDFRESSAFTLPEHGVKLDSVEKDLIAQALNKTQGNQSAAARLLGISRFALRHRMKKHELSKFPSS